MAEPEPVLRAIFRIREGMTIFKIVPANELNPFLLGA
jgi:hypothetical protein